MPYAQKDSSKDMFGFNKDEIAGVIFDDIVNNPPAIKMLFHYYHQIDDENTSLKNDLNTLNTYVRAYEVKKSNAATGAIMLSISNIFVGFGVNLLFFQDKMPGILLLLSGILLIAAGVYFTFFKENN